MKWRRSISVLLAGLAAAAVLAGGVLAYCGHVLSDSSQFATRATATLRDARMRGVIARALSSSLVSAQPDLVAVQPLVRGAAQVVVASAPFQSIIEGAIYDVHRTVFVRGSDTLTVRLANIGVLAGAALRSFAPSVASRIPESTSVVLSRIRGGEFGRVTDVAQALNRARTAGKWLLLAGLLGLVLSVALAVDRLAAVRRCGFVVLSAGLLGVVIYGVARTLVLDQFAAGDARTAAGVVWEAFLPDLRLWALGVAGAGALVAVVAWVMGRSEARATQQPSKRTAWRPGRLAPVVGVGALVLAGVFALASATGGAPALAHPIGACNGYRQLCDRPLNAVVFPATHNSMGTSTEAGWFFPSQDGGVPEQLSAGIRGLLIDTHYGVSTPKGVATVLTAQTRKLATVVDRVGPGFIATVDRLRAHIGLNPVGPRQVFLCHAFCEVGATSAQVAFGQIRDFLVKHPDQVVLMSIEDDVSPATTEAAFADSGLLNLVYSDPAGPSWPTLRQLIEEDRRLIVFGENDTDHLAWYRPQFKVLEETPFHFRSAAQLADASSCRPNRGGTGKSLFLVNNWVDTSPAPRPSNARVVDAYDALLARARRCEAERHHLPNLVAVDFYKVGDVLRVAATLNGL